MLFLSSLAVLFSFFRGSKLVTLSLLLIISVLYLLYSSGRIGGVDTPFYRQQFGSDVRCSMFEYGFHQLCRFDSPTGFSFTFLIASFLMIYAMYRCCENYRVLSLAFLIMFPAYFVIMDMGYLRQSMSVSFILLFCFNQENRKVRLLGYIIAPFFHISSIILIFFFELYYSTKKTGIFLLFVGACLISVAAIMLIKFINGGIVGLFSNGISLKSIVQLMFLMSLNVLASFHLRWPMRVTLFVMIVTFAGYFGHLYRVYLTLFPIIAFGVAGYLVKRKISYRFLTFAVFIIFGFLKLSATVFEYDGAFEIPYSKNSLLWFF